MELKNNETGKCEIICTEDNVSVQCVGSVEEALHMLDGLVNHIMLAASNLQDQILTAVLIKQVVDVSIEEAIERKSNGND